MGEWKKLLIAFKAAQIFIYTTCKMFVYFLNSNSVDINNLSYEIIGENLCFFFSIGFVVVNDELKM